MGFYQHFAPRSVRSSLLILWVIWGLIASGCTQGQGPYTTPKSGLTVYYYNNPTWSPPATAIYYQPDVNFYWETPRQRQRQAPFSMMAKGDIYIPETGLTRFFLMSDDGSALKIDGRMVIDNLGEHPANTETHMQAFEKGWHPIEIKYNDYGHGALLHVWWQRGEKEEAIPLSYFRPEPPRPSDQPMP